jgi:hypothetical protein
MLMLVTFLVVRSILIDVVVGAGDEGGLPVVLSKGDGVLFAIVKGVNVSLTVMVSVTTELPVGTVRRLSELTEESA